MKAALLTIAVVLAIAGCGGSDGNSDRQAVEGTIQQYFRATAHGDGATVCPSLTERASHAFAALLDVGPAQTCEANVRKVARRNLPLRATHVTRIAIADDRATADVVSERPPYSATVVLVRQDGRWKLAFLPVEIRRFQLPRIADPTHHHHH